MDYPTALGATAPLSRVVLSPSSPSSILISNRSGCDLQTMRQVTNLLCWSRWSLEAATHRTQCPLTRGSSRRALLEALPSARRRPSLMLSLLAVRSIAVLYAANRLRVGHASSPRPDHVRFDASFRDSAQSYRSLSFPPTLRSSTDRWRASV